MSKGGPSKIEETEEERELARVSADRWNDYVTEYIPFENKFIREIEVTDQEREGLEGSVNASVNSAFNNVREKVSEQETQMGAAPGSGRFNNALERVLQKQGRSLGYNKVDAHNDMDKRQVEGLTAAIQIGRGKEADALKGMSDLAGDAHENAVSDAEQASTRREGNLSGVGTAIGGYARHELGEE